MITQSLTNLAVARSLSVPALAAAHPGHGALDGNTIAHWLLDPLHAGPLLAGALLAVVAARIWLRRAR